MLQTAIALYLAASSVTNIFLIATVMRLIGKNMRLAGHLRDAGHDAIELVEVMESRARSGGAQYTRDILSMN